MKISLSYVIGLCVPLVYGRRPVQMTAVSLMHKSITTCVFDEFRAMISANVI